MRRLMMIALLLCSGVCWAQSGTGGGQSGSGGGGGACTGSTGQGVYFLRDEHLRRAPRRLTSHTHSECVPSLLQMWRAYAPSIWASRVRMEPRPIFGTS